MNGYGHFVPALFWADRVLDVDLRLARRRSRSRITRRGAEDSLGARTRLALTARAAADARRRAVPAGRGRCRAAGTTTTRTCSTNTSTPRIGATSRRATSATSRSTNFFPQPKVTAVDATIDIYPERRSFAGTGAHSRCRTSRRSRSRRFTSPTSNSRFRSVSFDRPFHLVSRAPRDLYSIYALEQPLAPGDVVTLTFSVSHTTRGFRDGNEPAEFAYNGTFFDAGYFPSVGYDAQIEIDDPRRRREEHLRPLDRDGGARRIPALAHEPLHAEFRLDHVPHVVSTSSDQIAIAPGYLQRTWEQNGRRHYFEYSMGSTHILDFFAYLSGRYATRKEVYNGAERAGESRGVLRPRAPVRHRRHARELARRAGLLPGALQPIPVHAVPHHGVPALPHVRAVVSEHRPVLRGDRLHRAG